MNAQTTGWWEWAIFINVDKVTSSGVTTDGMVIWN
jgi:hypothetical protein